MPHLETIATAVATALIGALICYAPDKRPGSAAKQSRD